MRALAFILVLATVALAAKQNPLKPIKTKKYKCIEVEEDHTEATHISFRKDNAMLRSLPKVRASEEVIDVPQVSKRVIQKLTTTVAPNTSPNVPRDSHNRPLILSPEHCATVAHYAKQYGVKDVLPWVEHNCHFAQMFVPTATCEEINILVASCYKNKYL